MLTLLGNDIFIWEAIHSFKGVDLQEAFTNNVILPAQKIVPIKAVMESAEPT